MPAPPPPSQEVVQFEYEPLVLEDTTLRLVRLQKGSTEQIECELLHTFFLKEEAFIEYEALSYTWGGSEKPKSITLNGKHMAVTENLFRALRHLREPEQDRILWIDALCINQKNVEERGHQVRQMPVIYRNALRVIIWLGLATTAEDQAMRGMYCFENAMKFEACSSWKMDDPRWLIMWDSVKNNASRVDERALYSLLNQAWFTRVWIIQEVTNARAARIYCGIGSVSTRAFTVMLSLVGIEPPSHCQAILDVMPGPSRKYSWWSEKPNLATLMYKFRDFKASDPRDCVYGLLGV
ncbi:heterokaryon incompatibility protein-domain-containing protein [Paraphoma chrysanthemicola]|uniref:Heterokaryon incompatibility protein-domain-containing protein n=1 Tax=Paraphoma chrysanthemicola TaxID=798071 RepID=A0A8K0RHL0_9PLEO|nr:heterokaryon incompatibility protein-domain-containing protein [Paraphoma chrysanthemicola]